MDGLNVEGILDAADLFQVAVDDYDVLLFLGKPGSQMIPDFSRPDDDDAHLLRRFLERRYPCSKNLEIIF